MGIEQGMPNFQNANGLNQIPNLKTQPEANKYKYVDENGLVSFHKDMEALMKFRNEKRDERN